MLLGYSVVPNGDDKCVSAIATAAQEIALNHRADKCKEEETFVNDFSEDSKRLIKSCVHWVHNKNQSLFKTSQTIDLKRHP